MRPIAILLGFSFAVASLPASATVWDCTYAGFTDSKIKVRAQYRVSRNFVYQLGTSNIPFRVLDDNEIALVAASGETVPLYMAPDQGATIGTRTIIIMKDTGEFNLINGF